MDASQRILARAHDIQRHGAIMSEYQLLQQRRHLQPQRNTGSRPREVQQTSKMTMDNRTASDSESRQQQQSLSPISPSAARLLSHSFARPTTGRPPTHQHEQQLHRDSSPSSLGLPVVPGTRTNNSNSSIQYDEAGDQFARWRTSPNNIPSAYNSALPAHRFTDADRAHSPALGVSNWLPQDNNNNLDFKLFQDAAAAGSWLDLQTDNTEQSGFYPATSFPYTSQRQQHPPPSISHPVTPTIRVTADQAGSAQTFGPSQPPDATTSTSALPPSDYIYAPPSYSSGNRNLRRPSMPLDADNMRTPVSPVSAHNSPGDTNMSGPQQMSRKRSHSVMSQQDAAMQHAVNSRAPSVASQVGASPGEEYSPRGSRAFKRGDPPTNAAGKYICDYAPECDGQIFDRKCEWSKHMDKHDRPYRCPNPSCAKLQGFTYSGGLLRHEREVHGKHGGPKAALMCPHPECKRHNGKGFTRKENLNEHLRRVHSTKEQTSQDQMLRRDGVDVFPGADEAAQTPASLGGMEATDPALRALLSPDAKRQRSLPAIDEQDGIESVDRLRDEIRRLQSETTFKDDRIRQLEEASAGQQLRMQHLEATVEQLRQQTQQMHRTTGVNSV